MWEGFRFLSSSRDEMECGRGSILAVRVARGISSSACMRSGNGVRKVS